MCGCVHACVCEYVCEMKSAFQAQKLVTVHVHYCSIVFFQEVVSFLMEFKAIDLLCGVIAKSRAPRATVSAAFYLLPYY